MPLRNRSYKRRFVSGVKLRRNRRATQVAANRRLTNTIKAVVQRGKESKDQHSAVSDGNLVNSTGAFHGTFLNMGQGGGVWARQGDFIQPTKLTIRFSFGTSVATSATRDDHNYVRLMICQLKVPQSEANAADFPDVWKIPSDDFRRKYKVLYDHRDVLNSKDDGTGTGGTLAYRRPIKTVNIYGKRLMRAQWSGVGPGASQPNVKGGIVMYAVSDSAIVAHPTLSFQFDEYAKDDD